MQINFSDDFNRQHILGLMNTSLGYCFINYSYIKQVGVETAVPHQLACSWQSSDPLHFIFGKLVVPFAVFGVI